MPNDISNAIGTARQFMPQPDGAYQGRYAGVQVSQAHASDDNFTELANNMSKLDAVLQGYAVEHEKRQNELGLDAATRMINSESPDDIRKLNVIDAAQQYGYADNVNNPYFKSYVAQLRGGFLATRMKQEYDEKFSMTPPKSLDEQDKRYSEFSQKWKDAFEDTAGAPVNREAFNKGFQETNLVNAASLANAFVKKEHEDDVSVLLASTQSKLGNIIKNSPELFKNDGALLTAAQTVFNEPRLMGLPSAMRQKLLDDWTQEYVRSGHLYAKGNYDAFTKMLDGLVVQTNMDGTSTKASELLDLQTLSTQNAMFNRQFLNQEVLDFRNKYIKSGDIKGAMQYVDEKWKADPDRANAFASQIDGMNAQIDADKRRKQTERVASANSMSKNNMQVATLKHHLAAWLNGSEVVDGSITASLSGVPDDVKNSVMLEQLQYVLNPNNEPDMSGATRAQYVAKTMSFPPFSHLRNSVIANYTQSIHNLVPNGDRSIPQSDNAKRLVSMYNAAPQLFADAWGNELASSVGAISSLANSRGDIDAGIADFAVYNALDDETKSKNKAAVEHNLAGYTIEGMQNLDGTSYTPLVSSNSQFAEALSIQAQVYMAFNNGDAVASINRAAENMKSNYVYYHGAFIPKGAYAGNTQSDSEAYFFEKGMERAIYNQKENVSDAEAEATQVRYDSIAQKFYIGDSIVSLSTIRKYAKEAYDKATEDDNKTNDDSGTLDDYNKQRKETYFTNDDTAAAYVNAMAGIV